MALDRQLLSPIAELVPGQVQHLSSFAFIAVGEFQGIIEVLLFDSLDEAGQVEP